MRARRIDSAQNEIVSALRAAGVSVHITSSLGAGFPDLVCGRNGQTYLLEIKTDDGELTPLQVGWHQLWSGHVAIVKSVGEALAAVGVQWQQPE